MKLSSTLPDKITSKLPMGSLYKDLLAYGKGLPRHEQTTNGYDFIFSNTLRAHGKH